MDGPWPLPQNHVVWRGLLLTAQASGFHLSLWGVSHRRQAQLTSIGIGRLGANQAALSGQSCSDMVTGGDLVFVRVPTPGKMVVAWGVILGCSFLFWATCSGAIAQCRRAHVAGPSNQHCL